VWTNLPPKFNRADERIPTAKEVLAYLGKLRDEERENAKEYVRRAPRQIDTEYRRAFEKELGWTPPAGT